MTHGNSNIKKSLYISLLRTAFQHITNKLTYNGTCNSVTVALLTHSKTRFRNKNSVPMQKVHVTPHGPAPRFNVVQSVKWRQRSRC